jgi:hypothetical protein
VLPFTDANTLVPQKLEATKDQALSEWAAAGVDDATIELLSQTEFKVANLGGSILGQTMGNTVVIDDDAAGFGWFIDTTPAENEEFEPVQEHLWRALEGSSANNRIDLSTVVLHELGHVAGLDHTDEAGNENSLMEESLSPGIRKGLDSHALDAVFDKAFGQ